MYLVFFFYVHTIYYFFNKLTDDTSKVVRYINLSKNYILEEPTPLKTNNYNLIKDKNQSIEFISEHSNFYKGIYNKNRNLFNIYFYKTNLINSKFINSSIIFFTLEKSKIIDNIFFNTSIKELELSSSIFYNVNFSSEYLDSFDTISDLSIETNIYHKVNLDDWKLYNSSIQKSFFNRIELNNLELTYSFFNNTSFTNSNINIIYALGSDIFRKCNFKDVKINLYLYKGFNISHLLENNDFENTRIILFDRITKKKIKEFDIKLRKRKR